MRRRHAIAALPAWALAGHSQAAGMAAPACAQQTGSVDIVANSFPVMQHLARTASTCAGAGFRVNFKLTPQVQNETELAFASAGRSPFDAAVVSQGVFSNLYSRNQLYPLNDLVHRYGAAYALEDRMRVGMNGEVMAIAFMQNTQHLYYRRDLFERHGLRAPSTHDELIAAAKVLKAREPDMPYPLAQTFSKGWDLATEFTNLLPALGGRFFEPGTAEPAFHSAAGLQAIDRMRALLPWMSPNALSATSDDVMNQLQQGKAAIGVLWASRAARMDDPAASRVVGRIAFAAAPAAVPGGRSASHLWWDGVALPRNGRPAQRDAAFQVVMQMLSAPSVEQGNDLAIWVRSNYRPGRAGVGVALAREAGAPVWPGEPFFGLAHSQLGKVLADALTGLREPQAVLAAAAQAYRQAAIEKGYLKARTVAASRT